MQILNELNSEQVRKIAEQETPKPMEGEWTLTAPDGRTWKAASPLLCLRAEGDSRIPALVQLARLRRAAEEPIEVIIKDTDVTRLPLLSQDAYILGRLQEAGIPMKGTLVAQGTETGTLQRTEGAAPDHVGNCTRFIWRP